MELKGPRIVWRRLKLENLHHLTSIHNANLQFSKRCSTQIRINKYTNRTEYREEKQTQAYKLIWFSAKKTKTLEKRIIFSSNGTRTTGYLVVGGGNKVWSLSHTIYKHYFEMDHTPKCKSSNHKIFRRKHRRLVFWLEGR